jgi:hypothetical protein
MMNRSVRGPVPRNGELAWISAPRFAEPQGPVRRNPQSTLDFTFPGSWEREPEPDTPNDESVQNLPTLAAPVYLDKFRGKDIPVDFQQEMLLLRVLIRIGYVRKHVQIVILLNQTKNIDAYG